jgi:hypothetical protein
MNMSQIQLHMCLSNNITMRKCTFFHCRWLNLRKLEQRARYVLHLDETMPTSDVLMMAKFRKRVLDEKERVEKYIEFQSRQYEIIDSLSTKDQIRYFVEEEGPSDGLKSYDLHDSLRDLHRHLKGSNEIISSMKLPKKSEAIEIE